MQVCLVMIVKNEERVLGRCLASVWPAVDAWFIVDTGSTDDTEGVIRAAIAEGGSKPGVLVSRPWVDFATNRTEALRLAEATFPLHALLMMDADDELHVPGRLPDIPRTAAGANVTVRLGNIAFPRPHVFLPGHGWHYVGKVHEVALHVDDGCALVTFPDSYWIEARVEGARSQNPNKYRDDAVILEADFNETGSGRSLFYAAQSWRDHADSARALPLYVQYANTPTYWSEERYVSCLNVVRLCPADDLDTAVQYGFLAFRVQPLRLEVACALLHKCRMAPAFRHDVLAMGLALLAVTRSEATLPDTFLFREPEVYTWRFLDELSLHAFYLGFKKLACKLMVRVLAACPETQLQRVRANIGFCGQ